MKKKLTPEEMGRNLEAFAEAAELEEEAKRLGTMTNAEVAASIAKSGHDQDAARAIGQRAKEAFAKAEAAAEEATANAAKEKPPPKVVALDERRARVSFWRENFASLALAAVTLLGVGVWFSSNPGERGGVAGAFDGGPNYETWRNMRETARQDFRAGRWRMCLEMLDQAKALVGGEENEEMAKMRSEAAAALAADAAVRERREDSQEDQKIRSRD